MVIDMKKKRIKILSVILCILVFAVAFPAAKAIETKSINNQIDDESRTYFVIGIGMFNIGSHFGDFSGIAPIFLIRFGNPGHHILRLYDESINFNEGDKFIGYYPFLNPVGVGFVCGIWIDI